MKKIFIPLTIAIISLSACKTLPETMDSENPNNTYETKINNNNPDGIFDILISFTSMASGIDYDAKKKVDNLIKDFKTKNTITINPEIIPWGREGEIDYGFKLKNLSTKQKKQFSFKLKAIVDSSNTTYISFNQKSVHKR